MSLVNVAYASTLTWAHPTLTRLEDQALVPMFGERPVELGLRGAEEAFLVRLRGVRAYHRLFPEAFDDDASPGRQKEGAWRRRPVPTSTR